MKIANKSRIERKSIPTKSDIKKQLQYSNLEERAIILLVSSSGLSAKLISNLTMNDFYGSIFEYIGDPEEVDTEGISAIQEIIEHREYISKENITGTWYLTTPKTGNEFYTFSSTESIKAIIAYLKERERINGTIVHGDDVLFENYGRKSDNMFLKQFFEGYEGESKAVPLLRLLQLNIHSLRKYFIDKLYKNGVSPEYVHGFLGKFTEQDDPFFTKEEYFKAVEDLSIGEFKLQTVPMETYNELKYDLRDEKIKTRKLEAELNSINKKIASLSKI